MRHLVRSLTLAAFLMLCFLRPQVSVAAPHFCKVGEVGSCTFTCASCSSSVPCPKAQGLPQTCICGSSCH
jgi:hypothetical protein